MRFAARFLSYLFHPLLFATYLVVLLSIFIPHFLSIPPKAVWKFAAFVAVITFVFPAANLVMLKAFGTIKTLEMEVRRDRLLPFFMIVVFYGVVCAMFYYKVSQNLNFNKLMLLTTALAAVAFIITIFFKISVHSMALGCVTGILVSLNKATGGDLLYPLVGIILLSGLVISARLYLQAHTMREVGYGTAIGFLIGFFGMTILF